MGGNDKLAQVRGRNPWRWIPTLYFAEGLPYVVVMTLSVIMYKRLQISNTDIAFYTSLLYLPWVVKPLWSPVVDIFATGRRWITSMQFIIGILFFVVAFLLPAPFFFKATLGIFWIAAFASATHDIAADGFYIQALDNEKQAFFVGIRSTFYRLAMIIVQGVAVMVAGWLELRTGNVVGAWRYVMLGLSVMLICMAVYHFIVLPSPVTDKKRKIISLRSVLREFANTFITFFQKKGAFAGILFLMTFRLSEAQLLKIAAPFMLDSAQSGGLDLSTGVVGFTYGTVGVVALVAGGILGGVAIARRGLRFWLWPMVIAVNLPNLLYVWLAYVQPETMLPVNMAVIIEQFGYGFGFTAYMVYMIRFSEGKYSASHYSLCTAFMAIGMMIPGMFAGWIADKIGYIGFFWWVFFSALPVFAILPFVKIKD
ncbi:MAG: MFS transporter [Bacteroidales bacterium]